MDVPNPRYRRADFVWLAAILILATVVRLIGLDAPLWFDEIATISTHIRLSWSDMVRDYSMNHHYFFSLQAKLSAIIFGDTIWAYRLPAMAFGVATVAAIWWLAKDIAGSAVAHSSALLTAISYHQVWFSQNARGYTELAFWSTLGLIFFLRGMKTPSWRVWIAFGLSLAAAVFTHLTGAFFFAALGLVWIITLLMPGSHKRTASHVFLPLFGALLGVGLVAVLYLPILPSVLETVGSVSGTSAVDPMQEYQNPLWTVVEGVRTGLGSVGALTSLVAVLILIIMTLGAVRAHRTAPLYTPAVLAHIALTIGALLFLGMRIWPRFFFVDIGFFLVLIVMGSHVAVGVVARALNKPKGEGVMFAVAVALMALVSLGLLQRNYAAPKQDLAAAFVLAEATRLPGEPVYSMGPSGPIYQDFFDADWENIRTPEDYDQAMAEPGPLILVVAFPVRMFRTIPKMKRDMGEALTLVRRFPGTLGDGDVLVISRN